MKATKENKIIGIGSIVSIYDFDLEEKSTFKIVSTSTDARDELSYDCALGEALLGKTVDERIIVKADEQYEVEILAVDNSNVQTKKTDRNIFFCFQREQYQSESEGEYIFALDGKGIPSWERLKEVKKGDIIFHCAEQAIFAISIAQGEYFYTVRPWAHYSANDYLDLKGNKVETKYQKLHTPIITCRYMDEIKILQGDSEGMGYPFNKNGKGNQGYLFNLKKSLAKFFMEKIVEKNPFMKEKDYVKELLQ